MSTQQEGRGAEEGRREGDRGGEEKGGGGRGGGGGGGAGEQGSAEPRLLRRRTPCSPLGSGKGLHGLRSLADLALNPDPSFS